MNKKKKTHQVSKTEKNKKARQDAFLAEYRQCATVTWAAKIALISRRRHYKWIEKDPAYAEAFEEAKVEGTESLVREARRRAIQGIEEPVIYQGKLSLGADGNPLVIHKHSDVLLIFLLKGMMPETFRERHEVTGGGGVALIPYVDKRLSKLTNEELKTLDEITRRLTAKTDN